MVEPKENISITSNIVRMFQGLKSKSPRLETESKKRRYLNMAAFWILGLCNNFPYVIMLSAAFDIIQGINNGGTNHHHNTTNTSLYGSCDPILNSTSNVTEFIGRAPCEVQGTSVILLADILPTFIIKLVAPYFMNFLPYWFRVTFCAICSASSFSLVAVSTLFSSEPLAIFGVTLASVSSGFGEITFLSLTARYDKSTVSSWSSGTGAAGVGGSLVYAGLKTFLSPAVTLLIQLVVPVVMFVTYFFMLGPAGSLVTAAESVNDSENSSDSDEKTNLIPDDSRSASLPRKRCPGLNKEEAKYWLEHVKYIPKLWWYMVPLFAVYTAEYMINQGFFELLYSPNTHLGALCLDQPTQYRWLQVIYQVGVFISRSSVSIYHFKQFWILSLLQVVNFVFFFTATWYLYLPSFWLTFFLVLWEGLLGGGVYVNAFYSISINVPKIHREFSMGVASVADSTGITVAGVATTFIHSFICGERIGYKLQSHL